jgi:SAM-dependent methyltransferase
MVELAAGRSLFRCPECRGLLHELTCPACGTAYGRPDGIPDFLGSGLLARRYREIAAHYDALYEARTDVWREQGHSDEFTRYVVDLVEAAGPGRHLDVGCGEGFFLTGGRRIERFGVDLSRVALMRARARFGATVAIAAAERLPFPDGAFDVVTSVGAMEHFLDDAAATAEIRRVLRPGGRYILALLVDVTLADRLYIKAREFLWPRPRPILLARWLLRKARPHVPEEQPAFPEQPVQNQYRARQVRILFQRSGFRTARTISKVTFPEAPLPGHYMRFYCLEAK